MRRINRHTIGDGEIDERTGEDVHAGGALQSAGGLLRFLALLLLVVQVTAFDAQAQNTSTPRKPIAESSLTLPEFFGLYAVQESGQMVELDKPVERLDERPTLALPAGVEFLVYGKDVDPSAIHLIVIPITQPQKKQQQGEKPFSWDDWNQQTQVDGPADFVAAMSGIPRGSREGKLLVKPVANQAQMLRLIPAGVLPDGIYQIGTPEKSWYRFVVGPMPAQSTQAVAGDNDNTQPATRRHPSSQNGAVREVTIGEVSSGVKSLFRTGATESPASPRPARRVASVKPPSSLRPAYQGSNEVVSIFYGLPTLNGEASKKSESWPFEISVLSVDPSNGKWEGELTWTTLDSVHKVIGTISDTTVTFAERKVITRGKASIGTAYELKLDNSKRRLAGTYFLFFSKGSAWIDLGPLPQAPIVPGNVNNTNSVLGNGGAQVLLDSTDQSVGIEVSTTDNVHNICPTGTLGAFQHGTRCTGYYDSDGLVDIQLSGVASTVPNERTKELVHPGVDIVAAEGAPISPIRDGVVIDLISDETDRNWKSLGYMVIVEHTGAGSVSKYFSTYLHMKQPPSVKSGDSVVAGTTVLGRVGHTGAAYGNHIHVEVRTFPDRFNPTWKSIYGKLTPESERTFDEAEFVTSWVDPFKFYTP